ncbi:MAG: efflux RND transporter permease subunit, partial [Limisphaera sp.]
MKALTDIFIRRPVLATVVNLVILIAGLQAIFTLTVRQYPRTDNAAITVTTVYVGASPDLVRGFVTVPLERAIAAADGIDYIESVSRQGISTITVRLKLNYDPNKALAEISSRVNQVRGDLPAGAEIPVISIENAESSIAAAYLAFTSDLLEANQITDYLVRVVQPRLSAIEGVQRADILGGRTFAMRIWLKPDRLAAYGLGPEDVRQALVANNFLAALGRTKGALVQVDLTANTDLRSAEEFRQLVIHRQGDRLVRLQDVADVVLGAENYDSEVRMTGRRAVFMGVWVLPTANTLDVIRRVRAEVDAVVKDLPSGMEGRIAYDATEYIENSIREVLRTLSETLLIVAIVIYLFLGSLRSVLVPLVAIPLSLIGAVFLMQVFGFTLNLLTLLAIVLSVGLVVDDAIVIVENVERHVREGLPPLQAALVGARELVGPVIAMTLTLAAVYAPIGFQGGLTGALFREFAFTLAGAVFISGVVALTLSPVLSARLLDPERETRGLAGWVNRAFDRLRAAYARVLDATLSARVAVYVLWLGLSLLVVPMYQMAPKELAPAEDQNVIFGIVEAPADATVEQTTFYTELLNEELLRVPEAKQTF